MVSVDFNFTVFAGAGFRVWDVIVSLMTCGGRGQVLHLER